MKVAFPIFLLLFALPATSSYAQIFEGVVTDFDGGTTLTGVIVTNKTKHVSTQTDVNGKFAITAYKADEIEFTYLGYYANNMLMPDVGKVFRKVDLKKKLYELDEIQIKPDYTPAQIDSIERKKIYGEALSRQRASRSFMSVVNSPVSALAEQFNKESKQVARFQKNYGKWENQRVIDERYSLPEVAHLTGLSGDTLAAFIHAYPMPVDYARSASDLEVKMWIRYNYKEWIKNPIVIPPSISTPILEADTLNNKP